MARPEHRKRQRVDKPSQDDRQVKRPRRVDKHPDSWRYPPAFWDNLSQVPLIHSAIEELDRRTCTRSSYPPPPTGLAQDLPPPATRELARFAKHGGPDLQDLRGYPPTKTPPGAISSSRSRVPESTNPTPTTPRTTTTKKSTSPYDHAFEQHLTDHAIYPAWKSQRPDLEDIMAALAVRRRSLSPSRFSEGAFETFKNNDAEANDEDDVKAHVIPTIIGTKRTDHPCAINTLFGNLEPLTDGTLTAANPGLYDGAYPEELDRSIRNELASHIIPSTMEDKPMAPNFFLEVKGPDGNPAVATRQACYDGAIGSRGIHSLQNYGREEPQYDGQAHTYSSTYSDGTLKLFAHHITAPTNDGGRPKYHMTQLRAFGMTDTRDTFVQGATAFRNARDLAKRHHDGFIQAANARAGKVVAAAAAAQEDVSPISHELHESVVRSNSTASQGADDALQQHITDARNYALEDDGEATTTLPRYLYVEDDSQEPSQEFEAAGFDDPSFGSSFKSSFGTSKRLRSLSPPPSSRGSQSSKSRKPPYIARRTSESSSITTESVTTDSSDPPWVETYECDRYIFFKNAEGKKVRTKIREWTEETASDGTKCFCWQHPESGEAFWATQLPEEPKEMRERLL